MNDEVKKSAIKELSRLSFPHDWESGDVLEEGLSLFRSFRNSDFYTERPGEEDDDFADFTGEAEALKIVNKYFSQKTLEHYRISVEDEGEKSWFRVTLDPK